MYKINNFRHAPCPTCLGKVSGRRDKIFCSLKCKNEHHRVARSFAKTHFGELQNRQMRNFIVLEGTIGRNGKSVIVHRSKLFKHGFDFKACTTSYLKNGKLYFEVGNFVFSFLNNGLLQVKRIKALNLKMPVFYRRWKLEFPRDLTIMGDKVLMKSSKPIQKQGEKTG